MPDNLFLHSDRLALHALLLLQDKAVRPQGGLGIRADVNVEHKSTPRSRKEAANTLEAAASGLSRLPKCCCEPTISAGDVPKEAQCIEKIRFA
jgi:hypothetical protein